MFKFYKLIKAIESALLCLYSSDTAYDIESKIRLLIKPAVKNVFFLRIVVADVVRSLECRGYNIL